MWDIKFLMRYHLIPVFLILILVLSTITPVDGSDATKREILTDLLAIDKPSLFEDYSELFLAKTKVQATIQGMDGSEVTLVTSECVNLFLEILDKFEAMTDVDDDPASHIEALRMADDVNSSISLFAGYDEASSNGIPLLLELALERFYIKEGEFFESASRIEKETAVRIEYMSISSDAYRKGDLLTDSSRMRFESARTRRIYEKDMEDAASFIDAAGVHLDNAEHHPPGFFGLTSGFMEVLKARDNFYSGKKIYELHSDRKLETIEELETDINKTYNEMIIAILKVLLAYLVLLAVLTFITYRRVTRWRKDLYDTRLGEELIS